jgi:phytoene dehydrogenase-like protein
VYDAVIVGAGLSGLCCARELHRRGARFLLLDAADAVGGRVRTDLVDGFRLDRGFQVFLTSYPEARQQLDYAALDLKSFLPGALVRVGGKFHTLTDPWRRPLAAFGSLLAPVGSLADKLRVARLRSRVLKGTIEDQFATPETTTRDALREFGFSDAMVERFFRPFLGGIFLDPTLTTSSRMFRFVFRMFSQGDACLPAAGMQAIPNQLAAGLPPESVRLGAQAEKVTPGAVTLAGGEELRAKAVVVATDAPTASKLLGGDVATEAQGVTCLYFAVDRTPVSDPVLVLDGDGRGPVNNLCVPTAVSPAYGPPGAHLVSASVLGVPADAEKLESEVREQLVGWFGPDVRGWRHLRTYRIPYALPRQFPPALVEPRRPVRRDPGLYVCGDHRDNASINGAMESGRRAAEAVLACATSSS